MKLFELLEKEFVFEAIKSPTKLREGNNPSVLDQAFTNYPVNVSLVQMLASLGKNDYVIFLLEL